MTSEHTSSSWAEAVLLSCLGNMVSVTAGCLLLASYCRWCMLVWGQQLIKCCTQLTVAATCLFRWNERFIEAKLSMVDRASKVDAVGEQVEKDLCLLGCTAIEDKLQEGVPQCIKTLAQAGIRLWVLTGDKMVRTRW